MDAILAQDFVRFKAKAILIFAHKFSLRCIFKLIKIYSMTSSLSMKTSSYHTNYPDFLTTIFSKKNSKSIFREYFLKEFCVFDFPHTIQNELLPSSMQQTNFNELLPSSMQQTNFNELLPSSMQQTNFNELLPSSMQQTNFNELLPSSMQQTNFKAGW